MASGDGQVRTPNDLGKEVAVQLARYKTQIEQSIPQKAADLVRPERAIRLLLNEVRRIPKLAECDPKTILGAMLTAASLGLDIGSGLGHAYVLPFKGIATFVPGYKGLITLGYRTPAISGFNAYVVRPSDEFKVTLGTERHIVHNPKLDDEGAPVAYYALATTANGGVVFDRPMTHAAILRVMQNSPAFKSGGQTPWKTHFEEMGRKTVARRLCKYLPTSAELAYAAQADETLEEGGKRPEPPAALDWLDGFGHPGEALDDGQAAGGALQSGPETASGEVVDEEREMSRIRR
jgi:recombination protein RecT